MTDSFPLVLQAEDLLPEKKLSRRAPYGRTRRERDAVWKRKASQSSCGRSRRNQIKIRHFRRHKVNCPEGAREGPLGGVRRK